MKKTKIEKKLKRKTNDELVKTIIAGKKNKNWLKVANLISYPKRKHIVFNLDEIDKKTKEGEIAIIPGKVLGTGEIHKKIKIVAFNFTETAKEKLKKSGIATAKISEEINKNPDAKGVKILS